MKRALRDALLSAVVFAVLIAMLALLDDRVRSRLTGRSLDGAWDRLTNEQGEVASVGGRAYQLIADNSGLTTLVVGASALVAGMLRT